MFVLGVSFFLAGIYTALQTILLYRWLKKNRYERWRFLTTAQTAFGDAGPGFANINKFNEYMKSKLDDEIEQIKRYKDAYRIGLRYMVIFLLAFLVVMGFVIFLIMLVKR